MAYSSSVLDFLGSLVEGCATIFAAIIVGIAGALISSFFSRAKDRQEKESQWRSHAIELAKLDMERQLATRKPNESIRPSILDFLANYRDLKELDYMSAKELYLKIEANEISTREDEEAGSGGRRITLPIKRAADAVAYRLSRWAPIGGYEP